MKKHLAGRRCYSNTNLTAMMKFNENDSVIYTDADGRLIDTFVFDTDSTTGLTHINHENRKVPVDKLVMHPSTVPKHHLPIKDAFSFEILRKLKEKYSEMEPQAVKPLHKVKSGYMNILAKAS